MCAPAPGRTRSLLIGLVLLNTDWSCTAQTSTFEQTFPDFVQSCAAMRLPAFVINRVIVWEGAHPPRRVVREWLSWPRTVADAVERVLQIVGDVPATPVECEALSETISDQFGLQSGNLELLEACGFDAESPNVVAEIIITQARQEQSRRRRGMN